MRRSGAAITACMTVLIVVVLLQVREQSERIRTLQDKVQTLENDNDLERTNALEEQVRSTAERLQNLEDLRLSLRRLSNEQATLRAELRRLSTPRAIPLDAGLDLRRRSRDGEAEPFQSLPPLPERRP